ncbi:ion transporter [Lineolata rhizophorae]|uniref:Voltage-gated hydrogen channel 1 n=1 Tax=Lineolata rhizophorae TaxID=578093 RepID=A0A6A6PC05_9PEZI|nr:ion transporter [Lineolata rhizophorae]
MVDREASQPLLRKRRSLTAHFGQPVPPSWRESAQSRAQASREHVRFFLTSKAGHYSILLLVGLDVTCIFADFVITIFTCKGDVLDPIWNQVLEALGIVSLSFSCLFMAELLASVWAFGFEYFKSKFHCFDAIVIVAGFIVDVLTTGPIEEVASLIVILRLWRVVKIIEELSVGAEEEMEDLQSRAETLEKENKELRQKVEELKKNTQGDVLSSPTDN